MATTAPSFEMSDVVKDPYRFFSIMRREAPVCKLSPGGFWLVSRYDDVNFVLKHPELFSSSGYLAATPSDLGSREEESLSSLIIRDPPDHTRLRSAVLKGFTPQQIAKVEPRLREVCHRLVDRVLPKESFDLIADIGIPIPVDVIAEFLGVEPAHRDDFRRWSDDMTTLVSFAGAGDRARVRRSERALIEYFRQALNDRKRAPRADVLTALCSAEAEGAMSMTEAISFALTLLVAGNETVTMVLGNMLLALTDHPDTYARVLADSCLIPAAIEEVLRYRSPTQMNFREATQDIELAGQRLHRGDVVVPLVASANRDEARFKDAHCFLIDRDTKGHVAFATGPHFCLGAALARLEIRVILEVLCERLGALRRVEPEVAMIPSMFVLAPRRLLLARVASS